MTLKTDFSDGDWWYADDANDTNTAVNELSARPRPADFGLIVFGKDTARAVGPGDAPMGVQVPRACTITAVRVWCHTADASGNLSVKLQKNGTDISGATATIPAGSQVGGQTVTGLSVTLAEWDKITVVVTGVGGTPGKGLACVVKAVAS